MHALLTSLTLFRSSALRLRRGYRCGRCTLHWRRRERLSALLRSVTLFRPATLRLRRRYRCWRRELRYRARRTCVPRCRRRAAIAGDVAPAVNSAWPCDGRRRRGRLGDLCRCNDSDGGCWCGHCGFQLPACSFVERATLSRGQLLLLRREAGRWCWRCAAGDDWPVEHAGRRRATLHGATKYALGARRNARNGRHRRAGNDCLWNLYRCLGYRPRLHERRGGHRDDGTRH